MVVAEGKGVGGIGEGRGDGRSAWPCMVVVIFDLVNNRTY